MCEFKTLWGGEFKWTKDTQNVTIYKLTVLTFKQRIKSHLPFAGIIRSSPYSPRFQDNG